MGVQLWIAPLIRYFVAKKVFKKKKKKFSTFPTWSSSFGFFLSPSLYWTFSPPSPTLLLWFDSSSFFCSFSVHQMEEPPNSGLHHSSYSFIIKAKSKASAWLPECSPNAFHSCMQEPEKQAGMQMKARYTISFYLRKLRKNREDFKIKTPQALFLPV